jgi:DNA repair protein RadC
MPAERGGTIAIKWIGSLELVISTSVLILHNHPRAIPPQVRGHGVDARLAAGVLMGIDVVDHLILRDVPYWSFKEAGRL